MTRGRPPALTDAQVCELRRLRALPQAERPTYRVLAERTGHSRSALQQAAAGVTHRDIDCPAVPSAAKERAALNRQARNDMARRRLARLYELREISFEEFRDGIRRIRLREKRDREQLGVAP